MTTAPRPPIILPAIFTSITSPSLAERGRPIFLLCTLGEAMNTPMRHMKRGINDAQINRGLAKKKPEKKIMVNAVKSRLVSFAIAVKKDHLG